MTAWRGSKWSKSHVTMSTSCVIFQELDITVTVEVTRLACHVSGPGIRQSRLANLLLAWRRSKSVKRDGMFTWVGLGLLCKLKFSCTLYSYRPVPSNTSTLFPEKKLNPSDYDLSWILQEKVYKTLITDLAEQYPRVGKAGSYASLRQPLSVESSCPESRSVTCFLHVLLQHSPHAVNRWIQIENYYSTGDAGLL